MSILKTLALSALLAQSPTPTPAAIVQRYIEALGGEAALRSVQTRVTTGRFDNGRGLATTFRILEKAPAARTTIIGSAPIDSESGSGRGFDGTNGWDKSFIGTGLRTVTGPELADLAREADMLAPLHLLDGCPSPVVERTAEANILRCQPGERPAAAYFFNSKSGLLDRYEVAAGRRGALAIRYEDYRTVTGLRLPFKWVIAVGGAEITYSASEIRHNETVDDRVFARPSR